MRHPRHVRTVRPCQDRRHLDYQTQDLHPASWSVHDVTRDEQQHPTIATATRGLPDWREIFGESVGAAAIVRGLVHNAVVFNISVP